MPAWSFRAVALAIALTGGCTRILLVPPADGGSGGAGGFIGLGGAGGDLGTGGDVGSGGSGAGGNGAGGTGTGGSGAGGTGVGGSGVGGSGIDAGPDTPTDTAGGVTPSAEGQLVITEVMADTNFAQDEAGEWFEVYNPSTTVTYDLMGCDLADTANHDVVASHVLVAPLGFVTLARFGTALGGFIPSYNYHTTVIPDGGGLDPDRDVKFGNGGDRVTIACGIAIIDVVNFSTAPWLVAAAVPKGRSYSLDPTHYSSTENDTPANWCTGTTIYAGSDMASPGRTNPGCVCSLTSCTWNSP